VPVYPGGDLDPQLSMSYSRAEGLLGGELISEQGFGA
jgi:hypothetical protein